MKKRFEPSEDEEDSGSEPETAPNSAAARRPGAAAAAAAPAAGSDDDGGSEEAPSSGGDGSGSDGSADSDGDSAEERELEQRLADVPLGVLAALRQDGVGPIGDAARAAAAAAKQRTFKRETKNRPQEVTSKRPVGRFREVIQVPKHRGVDPRFDPGVSGAPSNPQDQERERKRYAFIYDEVLPQELAALKQRLKKERREPKRREMQAELTRLEQRLREEKSRRKRGELEKGWKSEQKAAVAAGKKPFFLKKSEKRKLELVAKYEELKSSGKLEKYMAKRARKNASKDHRYLPGRRGDGE
ncbi:hypothetical protein Rsub_08613 [Raphidocelis subcapitata]|uniref:rRNA biogenesis protein RRP36 n=1 Tax=Raphidocelis subcapitata TaxID=307507 RepID=A0A2V0P6Y6_9CHLO|nr:hypothetical protein Rsub_08613 [Raphidocelis subcapitata]|eukprot:GBF95631.1 hypothetical protein Rsub_08613 [Raphidocelis subcapitata]